MSAAGPERSRDSARIRCRPAALDAPGTLDEGVPTSDIGFAGRPFLAARLEK